VTFFKLQNELSAGNTSCFEIVSAFIENIRSKQDLNSYVEVFEDSALSRAKEIDKKIEAGTQGKLAGLVVSIKDLLCYDQHHVSGGSKILEGFESQFTSSAVQRLLDEDAIIIGRTNCDEFGMGSSNENSAYGPVKNALDTSRVPGGSSGGAAVSVQQGSCHVAIGSDTGGSVRQPASFCGLYGLKPTYSRISRYGLLAYASSFDTIGLFSKDIESCELVYQTIAGHDPLDSTSANKSVNIAPAEKKAPYKIAILKNAFADEGLQGEVKDHFQASIEKLKNAGNTIEEVDFPLMDYILPTYYILTTAEASSNLSRYDGVRYGYRAPKTKNLESLYKMSRSGGFGDEVKRRIFLGTFVLSASYYDAYYTRAQKARRLIRQATKKMFEDFDFVISPTSATTAFKLGEHASDPLAMYLSDLYTVQASVAGIPAIVIPDGQDKNGLPIGLQVMADDFKEQDLFSFSEYLKHIG